MAISVHIAFVATLLQFAAGTCTASTQQGHGCQAHALNGDDVVAMLQHTITLDKPKQGAAKASAHAQTHAAGGPVPKHEGVRPRAPAEQSMPVLEQLHARLNEARATVAKGEAGMVVVMLLGMLGLLVCCLFVRSRRPETSYEGEPLERSISKDQWQDRWKTSSSVQSNTQDPFSAGAAGPGSAKSGAAGSWHDIWSSAPASATSAAQSGGLKSPVSGRRMWSQPMSAGSLSGAMSPQFGGVVPPAASQQSPAFGTVTPGGFQGGQAQDSRTLLDAVRAARGQANTDEAAQSGRQSISSPAMTARDMCSNIACKD